MKIISKLFQTISNILAVIIACLAVVLGLRTSSRKQRYFATVTIIVVSAGIMTLTIATHGFIFTTTIYTILSLLRYHSINLSIENGGWSSGIADMYNSIGADKNQLIADNGIAAFLSACNASTFGKVIQIAMLVVGTLMFIAIIIMFFVSCYVLVQTMVGSYLVRHRNGKLYNRKYDEFVSTMRSTKFSYKEMKNHYLYSVFCKEPDVILLIQRKREREEMNRRYATRHGRG